MALNPQKVALVTGASTGIGLAVATRLAAAGYRVFGASRRGASGAAGAPKFSMIALDVTDDTSVAHAVAEVIAQAGRIDLLVNNAGFGVTGGAEESSIDQAKAIFDTNVYGVIRMTRAVLPHMRGQGHGRIVNISSVLGFIPAPYSALYAATKHAVEGYSESLDHEVRHFGVKVILIEPAYTKTAFETNMSGPDEPLEVYAQARRSTAALIKEVLETGDAPEVVAETVLKAARAAKPKLRYPAGKVAGRLAIARRLAPSGAFDKTLRKEMKLQP